MSSRTRAPRLDIPAGASHATVEVPFTLSGVRIDKALPALIPALSRAQARKAIGLGGVWIGGRRCRVASRTVSAGDQLTAVWRPDLPSAGDHALRVLHQDQDLVVVDKPAGQLSAGTALGDVGSLSYQLRRTFGPSIRLMHRLDQHASGLIVAARSQRARRLLAMAFMDHDLERSYLALVHRPPPEGLCDTPLVRAGSGSRPAGPLETSSAARTRFEVRARTDEVVLVAAQLETGRTHQVRVHLASLGSPIIGDRRYRGPTGTRLCLHAHTLSLPRPGGGAPLSLTSDPGLDFWSAAGLSGPLDGALDGPRDGPPDRSLDRPAPPVLPAPGA